MADVMTTVGMRTNEVRSAIDSIGADADRLRQKLSTPIAMKIVPAGSRLAGYGNPLFASAFRDTAAVRQMEARMGVGSAEGESGDGEGFGRTSLRLGVYAAAAYAAEQVLNKVAEAGRAQREWRMEVERTNREYARSLESVGRVKDSVREARDRQVEEGNQKADAIIQEGLKNMGADESSVRRGGRRIITDAAALASRIPWLNEMYDFGDGRRWFATQAKYSFDAQQQAEFARRKGREAGERAEILAAQEKFVRDGRQMSQDAETAQRERMEHEKTVAAKKKAREESVQQLQIDQLADSALLKRLQKREKEALLLEAKADYLRRAGGYENNENLSTAERSQGQIRAWEIYQQTLGAINRKQEEAIAIRGFDMSAGGGPGSMIASTLNTNTTKQQQSLDAIDKNTRETNKKLAELGAALLKSTGAIWN